MSDYTETKTPANETDSEVAKVNAKNKDLLGKLKAATTTITTLESRLTDLEDAQADIVDTTKTDAQKVIDRMQKQLDKLTATNTDLGTRLNTVLIDKAIAEKLGSNAVDPADHRALTAMFKMGATLENGEAVFDGGPLADAMDDYFANDGKRYLPAPVSSGGGATGSRTVAPTMTRDNFSLTKLAEIAKTDVAQANSISKSLGYNIEF